MSMTSLKITIWFKTMFYILYQRIETQIFLFLNTIRIKCLISSNDLEYFNKKIWINSI